MIYAKNMALNVAVLVLDECNTLAFAAAVDPMRAANRLAGKTVFHWQYVTAEGHPAQLTSGLSVPGTPISRLDTTDLLIILAGFNLAEQASPALSASLRRLAASGADIAGIDGGPWIMAAAGLLDGYSATTHWEDWETFAQTFPDTHMIPDRYRIDGARMTSGGAMPAIDMMLDLITSRFGSALAARVAGVFIHDMHSAPDRAQRRLPEGHRHSPLTARATQVMETTLANPLPLPDLARRCGASLRALQLQFRSRLSTTPQAHYVSLRLAEALRLVTDTDLPLTEVALACGYTSQSTFARAFRNAHGASARALRRR